MFKNSKTSKHPNVIESKLTIEPISINGVPEVKPMKSYLKDFKLVNGTLIEGNFVGNFFKPVPLADSITTIKDEDSNDKKSTEKTQNVTDNTTPNTELSGIDYLAHDFELNQSNQDNNSIYFFWEGQQNLTDMLNDNKGIVFDDFFKY